jgi:hypothetical protein
VLADLKKEKTEKEDKKTWIGYLPGKMKSRLAGKDHRFFSNRRQLPSSLARVLDEPHSQLIPLSGVAVQARQSTKAGTVSILCSLAGRYDYSAELA